MEDCTHQDNIVHKGGAHCAHQDPTVYNERDPVYTLGHTIYMYYTQQGRGTLYTPGSHCTQQWDTLFTKGSHLT
jgi:hypothetical protein